MKVTRAAPSSVGTNLPIQSIREFKYYLWTIGYDKAKLRELEILAAGAGVSLPVYVRERFNLNIPGPIVQIPDKRTGRFVRDLNKGRPSAVVNRLGGSTRYVVSNFVLHEWAAIGTAINERQSKLEAQHPHRDVSLVQFSRRGGTPDGGLQVCLVFRVEPATRTRAVSWVYFVKQAVVGTWDDIPAFLFLLESELAPRASLVHFHRVGFSSAKYKGRGRPGRGLEIVAVFKVREGK